MKVVARHKDAPLVALDDGSIIDTDDLEVIGNGFVASAGWEVDPDVEMDPRWEEIATADGANLGVTERRVASGPRTYRAPSSVRDSLVQAGVATPLAEGKGLTLDELSSLCENDAVDGPAEEWIFSILNKHEDNPDETDEAELYSLAEPELDFDEINAALNEGDLSREDDPDDYNDDDALVAAVEPPPGDFTKVVYLALIEEDDTKSVQDLVALVSTKAGAAAAYTYGDKGWEENPEVLTKLQAPAPPPIKQLEDWQTESIVAQMASTHELSDQAKDAPYEDDSKTVTHAQPENPDGPQETVAASAFNVPEGGVIWGPDNKSILSVILAAGGADRNRGNAETLRRYWTIGKGGAKIRWGTPGDWTRCRRHLSKYLGERAAGYCQLRHHEMTGMWTGSRAHRALSAAAPPPNHVDHPRQGNMTIQEQMARDKAGGSTPSNGSTRLGTRPSNPKGERAYNRYPPGASNSLGGQFAPGKSSGSSSKTSAKKTAAAKTRTNAELQYLADQQGGGLSLETNAVTDAEKHKLTISGWRERAGDTSGALYPPRSSAEIRILAKKSGGGVDTKGDAAISDYEQMKLKKEGWEPRSNDASGKLYPPSSPRSLGTLAALAKKTDGGLDVGSGSTVTPDEISAMKAAGWGTIARDPSGKLYPPGVVLYEKMKGS